MKLLFLLFLAVIIAYTIRVSILFKTHPGKAWRMLKFALGGPMIFLMNDYGSSIDRTGAQALIPEDVSKDIIKAVPQQSAIMSLARKLPNMSTGTLRMPILASLIQAYFTNGDTGLRQTAKAEWENKYIYAEEMNVMVPIPIAVLDDAAYDIWGEIKPYMVEAFGQAFDLAVCFGYNAPNLWPTNLFAGATAAGHIVAKGTNADLYDDILGENGTLSFIEEDGYDATGHVSALNMKAKLRGLRDADGNPLFKADVQNKSTYALDGTDIFFSRNGGFDKTKALMISGEWEKLVWAIRQDITYQMFQEAVWQDPAGNIVYNFAQQRMKGLLCTIRLGWQLPNPINREAKDAATRYPFSILTP